MNLSDVERLRECSMFIKGKVSSTLKGYDLSQDNVIKVFKTTDGKWYHPKRSVNAALNNLLIGSGRSSINHRRLSSTTNSGTCSKPKITLVDSQVFELTIGGKNLKNAGSPKVSDDYGDGV